MSLLKDGIDLKYVKEPLAKIRKKMEQKNIKFSLKTVTEKTVYKAICSLKKKKSAGIDGIISQEELVLGAKVLVVPLTRIISNSISSGEFHFNMNRGSCNNDHCLLSCQHLIPIIVVYLKLFVKWSCLNKKQIESTVKPV
jgi:hypothetical protein